MKTALLKILSLPFSAFLIASGGALATPTQQGEEDLDSLITGYIHMSTFDSCDNVTVDCNRVSGPPCTLGSFTVYDKANHGVLKPCNLPLYRN